MLGFGPISSAAICELPGSGGVAIVPSTGTPDATYVAVSRDANFTASQRGTNYVACSRDAEYTAKKGP